MNDEKIHVNWQTIRSRRKRVYRRIDDMLFSGYEVYFFTLTLADDSKDVAFYYKQAKDYVASLCTHYILNIDYGKKYGRLHFHAVGIFTPLWVCPVWLLGFSNIKQITALDDFNRKRYAKKLAYHSLKGGVPPTFSRNWAALEKDIFSEDDFFTIYSDIMALDITFRK